MFQGRKRLIDQLMAEHIGLPGVGGIIVTREFAYQWMKDIGYDPSDRGFGSIDYIVFGQEARPEELTDLAPLKEFLASILASMRCDCFGVE